MKESGEKRGGGEELQDVKLWKEKHSNEMIEDERKRLKEEREMHRSSSGVR